MHFVLENVFVLTFPHLVHYMLVHWHKGPFQDTNVKWQVQMVTSKHQLQQHLGGVPKFHPCCDLSVGDSLSWKWLYRLLETYHTKAGVFPDPDGATAIMKRFPGSSHVPNTFTVVFPINALVDVSALIKSSSRVLLREIAYTVNHSLAISGTTASNGKITFPSFSSKSLKEWIPLSLSVAN